MSKKDKVRQIWFENPEMSNAEIAERVGSTAKSVASFKTYIRREQEIRVETGEVTYPSEEFSTLRRLGFVF